MSQKYEKRFIANRPSRSERRGGPAYDEDGLQSTLFRQVERAVFNSLLMVNGWEETASLHSSRLGEERFRKIRHLSFGIREVDRFDRRESNGKECYGQASARFFQKALQKGVRTSDTNL